MVLFHHLFHLLRNFNLISLIAFFDVLDQFFFKFPTLCFNPLFTLYFLWLLLSPLLLLYFRFNNVLWKIRLKFKKNLVLGFNHTWNQYNSNQMVIFYAKSCLWQFVLNLMLNKPFASIWWVNYDEVLLDYNLLKLI